MQVPPGVRAIYESFPLYTHDRSNQEPLENTLYVYNTHTRDPNCIIAAALLGVYGESHVVVSASPCITPKEKLPIYVKNGKEYDVDGLIALLVPESARSDQVPLSLAKVLSNAWLTMMSEPKKFSAEIRSNYLDSSDEGRLWPFNRMIANQLNETLQIQKGPNSSSALKLEAALRAANDLLPPQSGEKLESSELTLFDIVVYGYVTALGQLMEVPNGLQRHGDHVYYQLLDGKKDEKPKDLTM